MNILRKMLVFLLATLLPLFLFWLAISTGIIKIAGSSEDIKKTLADSNIYSSIIPNVLDQAKTSGEGSSEISLKDPTIKAVAEKTFTPQYLQENTEKVLDSVFLWLEGNSPRPDFRIDLSELKTTFATEAAKAAQERAATLPACPAGLSGSTDNFDPFAATCLPRGLTPALAADEVKNSLSSGEGFLEDPVITADTLKESGSDQSLFDNQLKDAPDIYQKAKMAPLILAILSLLAIAGIVFLSSSRRAGLRRAGISLLTVGVALLVFAWVLNYAVNQKILPKLEDKPLHQNVKTLATDITGKLDKIYYTLGGVYAGLGIAAIAVPMFIHRDKNEHSEPQHAHSTESAAGDGPEPTETHESAKKTSKNIKVQ